MLLLLFPCYKDRDLDVIQIGCKFIGFSRRIIFANDVFIHVSVVVSAVLPDQVLIALTELEMNKPIR